MATQAGDGPTSYVYRVTLPDGRQGLHRSQRVYRVGEHVKLLYSRGKVTGRILLTAPAVRRDEAVS